MEVENPDNVLTITIQVIGPGLSLYLMFASFRAALNSRRRLRVTYTKRLSTSSARSGMSPSPIGDLFEQNSDGQGGVYHVYDHAHEQQESCCAAEQVQTVIYVTRIQQFNRCEAQAEVIFSFLLLIHRLVSPAQATCPRAQLQKCTGLNLKMTNLLEFVLGLGRRLWAYFTYRLIQSGLSTYNTYEYLSEAVNYVHTEITPV